MDLKKFLSDYPSVLFSPERDSIFSDIRIITKGMSSMKEGKLLNYASSLLGENEYYLEIGSYMGFSICSSGYERNHICVGIDNFSENYATEVTTPQNIKDELIENLKFFVKNGLIVPADFRVVDMKKVLMPEYRIGVFYIDGKHEEADVTEAVSKFRPDFADQAVLMFDDTNIPAVRRGIDKILEDPGFEEVFHAKSDFKSGNYGEFSKDPYIHNGFSVVAYRGGIEL